MIINDIYSSIMSYGVDLKHDYDTRWKNVLLTLENMGTCVEFTWDYSPCVVLFLPEYIRKECRYEFYQSHIHLLLF